MPHSTGQIICCEQQYPRNKDQHRLQMHMPRHLKQCIVTKQQNVYKILLKKQQKTKCVQHLTILSSSGIWTQGVKISGKQ